MPTTPRQLATERVRSILERRYRRYRTRRLLPSPLLRMLRAVKRALPAGGHARQSIPVDQPRDSADASSVIVSLSQFNGEFELPTRNALTRHILDGGFEAYITDLLRAAVSTGDHILDVGANLGVYAVLAGKLVGPEGRVLAAEPVPSMLRLLQSNIARNALHHVSVFPGVVSDSRGSCTMELVVGGEEYSSIGGIAHPDVPAGQRQKITVASETLDSLIARFDLHPAVIKVDTEGAEALVFSHAGDTLREYQPIIFSELDQRLLAAHSASARGVAERWFAHGYETYNALTGEAYSSQQFPSNFVGDIVALPGRR